MNGFTKSIDRKIEASKRRQAEEERAKAPNRAPTQGLTDPVSTPNCNVPSRSVPLGGCVIEGAAHFGPGAELVGHTFERVVFDPPINVQEGDTIEMRAGTIHITPGRAALPVDQICTVPEAMDRLKLAMQQDPDYARTWHDNIAMAFVDGMRWTDEALGMGEPDQYTLNHTRRAANRAAVHLMDMAFQADTSKHAASLRNKADFWDNLANARPLNTKIVKNTGIAGSLDAQLAAAKAESPAPAVRNLLAEMADDIERMRSIPPDYKARAMFFGGSQWEPPVKADLSDAKGCITRRVIDFDQLEAMFPRKDDLSDPIKDAMAAETYIRRVHLDPKAK